MNRIAVHGRRWVILLALLALCLQQVTGPRVATAAAHTGCSTLSMHAMAGADEDCPNCAHHSDHDCGSLLCMTACTLAGPLALLPTPNHAFTTHRLPVPSAEARFIIDSILHDLLRPPADRTISIVA